MKDQFFICTGTLFPHSKIFSISETSLDMMYKKDVVESTSISIENSVVTVKIVNDHGWGGSSEHWENLLRVLWKANWFSGKFFSATSLIKGTLHTTSISKIETPDGRPLFSAEDHLVKRNFSKLDFLVEDVFCVFRKHHQFSMAVEDYMLALRAYLYKPWDVSFYLYRSLESLRECFSGKDEGVKWMKMHKQLGTDQSTIQSLIQKPYADKARHGKLLLSPNDWNKWVEHTPKAFLYVRGALSRFVTNERE